MILAIIFSMAMLTSALSVQSSPNSAQIYAGQTTAYLKIWFTNNASQTENFYVNTQTQLEASIDQPSGTIQPGETKTATISITAPSCFEGIFNTQTTIQLSDGETQTINTPISVINQAQCAQYTQQPAYTGTSYPTQQNSPLAPIQSTVQFESYFNPTYYNLKIISANQQVSNGVQTTIPIKIINEGASGTFQIQILNADQNINTNLNENTFNLLTNEMETAYLTVKPENMQPGTYPIQIEIIQGSQVVSQTTAYATISPVYNAVLAMPKSVSCQSEVQGSLTNTGNAEDTYTLTSNGVLNETTLNLQPGETGLFTIQSNNQTEVIVYAKSGNVQGNASTTIDCNNLVELPQVLVTNTNNYTLPNVTVTATNIPASWDVLSEPPVDLQPGESRNFTVYLRENTPATNVQPTALVESNGNVIAQKQMPTLNGNLTGYFTGILDNNLIAIGVIVFIAILIAVYSTRAKLEEVEENTYQQKIQAIKSQINT